MKKQEELADALAGRAKVRRGDTEAGYPKSAKDKTTGVQYTRVDKEPIRRAPVTDFVDAATPKSLKKMADRLLSAAERNKKWVTLLNAIGERDKKENDND